MENWSMLSRLRNAVKKLKILLNLNFHRWHIASMIGASSGKRCLSFKDRPGLRACTDDHPKDHSDSGSSSGRSTSLHRTISYPSEDDIDKRAEIFIEKFHKQLRIERQISLELRYCRANSFDWSSP